MDHLRAVNSQSEENIKQNNAANKKQPSDNNFNKINGEKEVEEKEKEKSSNHHKVKLKKKEENIDTAEGGEVDRSKSKLSFQSKPIKLSSNSIAIPKQKAGNYLLFFIQKKTLLKIHLF
jgi:hypothetical protein